MVLINDPDNTHFFGLPTLGITQKTSKWYERSHETSNHRYYYLTDEILITTIEARYCKHKNTKGNSYYREYSLY